MSGTRPRIPASLLYKPPDIVITNDKDTDKKDAVNCNATGMSTLKKELVDLLKPFDTDVARFSDDEDDLLDTSGSSSVSGLTSTNDASSTSTNDPSSTSTDEAGSTSSSSWTSEQIDIRVEEDQATLEKHGEKSVKRKRVEPLKYCTTESENYLEGNYLIGQEVDVGPLSPGEVKMSLLTESDTDSSDDENIPRRRLTRSANDLDEISHLYDNRKMNKELWKVIFAISDENILKIDKGVKCESFQPDRTSTPCNEAVASSNAAQPDAEQKSGSDLEGHSDSIDEYILLLKHVPSVGTDAPQEEMNTEKFKVFMNTVELEEKDFVREKEVRECPSGSVHIDMPLLTSAHDEVQTSITVHKDGDLSSIRVPKNIPLSMDVQEDVPSTSVQEDLPSTSVQEDVPSSSVQEDVASTSVQEDVPSTSVQEDVASTSVQEDVPSTSVQEDLPSTSVQEDLPSTSVQEEVTSDGVQENLPLSICVQDDVLPSTGVSGELCPVALQEDPSTTSVQKDESCASVQKDESSASVQKDESSASVQKDYSSSVQKDVPLSTSVQKDADSYDDKKDLSLSTGVKEDVFSTNIKDDQFLSTNAKEDICAHEDMVQLNKIYIGDKTVNVQEDAILSGIQTDEASAGVEKDKSVSTGVQENVPPTNVEEDLCHDQPQDVSFSQPSLHLNLDKMSAMKKLNSAQSMKVHISVSMKDENYTTDQNLVPSACEAELALLSSTINTEPVKDFDKTDAHTTDVQSRTVTEEIQNQDHDWPANISNNCDSIKDTNHIATELLPAFDGQNDREEVMSETSGMKEVLSPALCASNQDVFMNCFVTSIDLEYEATTGDVGLCEIESGQELMRPDCRSISNHIDSTTVDDSSEASTVSVDHDFHYDEEHFMNNISENDNKMENQNGNNFHLPSQNEGEGLHNVVSISTNTEVDDVDSRAINNEHDEDVGSIPVDEDPPSTCTECPLSGREDVGDIVCDPPSTSTECPVSGQEDVGDIVCDTAVYPPSADIAIVTSCPIRIDQLTAPCHENSDAPEIVDLTAVSTDLSEVVPCSGKICSNDVVTARECSTSLNDHIDVPPPMDVGPPEHGDLNFDDVAPPSTEMAPPENEVAPPGNENSSVGDVAPSGDDNSAGDVAPPGDDNYAGAPPGDENSAGDVAPPGDKNSAGYVAPPGDDAVPFRGDTNLVALNDQVSSPSDVTPDHVVPLCDVIPPGYKSELTPLDDKLAAPKHDAILTRDDAVHPGDVTSPGDDVTSTGDNVLPTSGDVTSPGDDVTSTGDNVLPTSDDVAPPGDDVTSTGDNVLPTSDDVAPPGDDVTSTGDNVLPISDDVAPSGDDVTSTGDNVLPISDYVTPPGGMTPPCDVGDGAPPRYDTNSLGHDTDDMTSN